MKYIIKDLRSEFGTDAKCLQFVFGEQKTRSRKGTQAGVEISKGKI